MDIGHKYATRTHIYLEHVNIAPNIYNFVDLGLTIVVELFVLLSSSASTSSSIS